LDLTDGFFKTSIYNACDTSETTSLCRRGGSRGGTRRDESWSRSGAWTFELRGRCVLIWAGVVVLRLVKELTGKTVTPEVECQDALDNVNRAFPRQTARRKAHSFGLQHLEGAHSSLSPSPSQGRPFRGTTFRRGGPLNSPVSLHRHPILLCSYQGQVFVKTLTDKAISLGVGTWDEALRIATSGRGALFTLSSCSMGACRSSWSSRRTSTPLQLRASRGVHPPPLP
jgi:hypothetical protein